MRRGGELDVLISAADLTPGFGAALIAMEDRGLQILQTRRLLRNQSHGLETAGAYDIRHGFLLFHPDYPNRQLSENPRTASIR